MSTAAATKQQSMFAVFRKRNFTLLWLGQLVSEFGNGLTSVTASILVYRETGSAASVGLMLMATALPSLLFGLIAGVFVDRYDRKRIMIASDLLRGLLILLIPVLLPYGIAWLYILVMLSSAVTQFFSPAHASVIPEVASDEELAAANSLLVATTTGALGLGFAAAGLISSTFSPEIAFYIDGLTFLLSACTFTLLRIRPLEVTEDTSVAIVVENLKGGLRFLWDSPAVRSVWLVFIPVYMLFGLHNSLLLPFSDRALGATEFQYGLIEGVAMVGFVAGALLMARFADRLREGQWIVVSLGGMGLLTVIYSQLQSINVAIALGVLMAFMNVPSFVGKQLIVQRYTTRAVRGRVNSAFFFTRDAFFMVGMGLAGLADVVDIRVLMLIEGALTVGVGLLAQFLPGLGQPAAQWRRALGLLRGISEAPGLSVGRSATMADLERYATSVPALAALSQVEQQRLVPHMTYAEAAPGAVVVREGDVSDAAYFILEGHAVAGRTRSGREDVLGLLSKGDFFGEIAALTGVPRTADVMVDEQSVLLRVPAPTLQEMARKPELNSVFTAKIAERLARTNIIDLPRASGFDQEALRDLRTLQPAEAT